MPEEVNATESASEIILGLLLNNYSGETWQSLATTGFVARLVSLLPFSAISRLTAVAQQ
jgi:hypothetical protein